MLPYIRYNLVYDSHVDGPELSKLLAGLKPADRQLINEIVEEERQCEA